MKIMGRKLANCKKTKMETLFHIGNAYYAPIFFFDFHKAQQISNIIRNIFENPITTVNLLWMTGEDKE